MLNVVLDIDEGIQIGTGPDNGAVVKVLARTGRRVRLAVLTNLRVTRTCFGLNPPVFAPGLAAVRGPGHDDRPAVSCAAG